MLRRARRREYDLIVRFEVPVGTTAALTALGAVDPDSYPQRIYPWLPVFVAGDQAHVHWKFERLTINYGLSQMNKFVFRVQRMSVVERR